MSLRSVVGQDRDCQKSLATLSHLKVAKSTNVELPEAPQTFWNRIARKCDEYIELRKQWKERGF